MTLLMLALASLKSLKVPAAVPPDAKAEAATLMMPALATTADAAPPATASWLIAEVILAFAVAGPSVATASASAVMLIVAAVPLLSDTEASVVAEAFWTIAFEISASAAALAVPVA